MSGDAEEGRVCEGGDGFGMRVPLGGTDGLWGLVFEFADFCGS